MVCLGNEQRSGQGSSLDFKNSISHGTGRRLLSHQRHLGREANSITQGTTAIWNCHSATYLLWGHLRLWGNLSHTRLRTGRRSNVPITHTTGGDYKNVEREKKAFKAFRVLYEHPLRKLSLFVFWEWTHIWKTLWWWYKAQSLFNWLPREKVKDVESRTMECEHRNYLCSPRWVNTWPKCSHSQDASLLEVKAK